ncbi:MAG: response regulator transcription factor [Betaproteobacteria bacterium]|nr:response regulator transcription factor [Betaproteobacteria bacterium]MDE2212069.1 response regulator transcription factor [Betaproteobacteria bacterium]MDE2354897.1 response regulator transcription factor [Betaproteobacteria bacterium]MDE2623800.1 response regulator transcription factor [Betaproteobacteria bacterium]
MRILVVEDDRTLGKAMSASLEHSGFAVDWVGGIADAQHMLGSEHFDAIVLDLGLPDGDGYAVVRALRSKGATLPVLILTARDAVEDRVQGLDLGADDYIIKPVAMAELQARLRALIRRSAGTGSARFSIGALTLDTAGRRAFLQEQPLDLSGREWGVLEYLATHARRIVSKEQLIQALTSLGQDLSENAIEAYVHRLRGKIEGSGTVIRTVRGLGYMLEQTDEPAH